MAMPVALSVSAEKDPRERAERYKTKEPARVEEVHDFLFEAFINVQKCWRQRGLVGPKILQEFQIQARTADLRTHRVKFN
jgi:hypothetical protein